MNNTLKTILKSLIVFTFTAFIFHSCTKIDVQNPASPEENFAEKFFGTKQSTVNKDVQEIIKKLKEQNIKSGFVEKLPRNYGFPIWEKSGYVSSTTSGNNLTGSYTSGDYIYVPMAETSSGLSAIIVAHQQNDSLDIRFYSKDYLYDVCHASNLDIAKAESILALFFTMENYCFGTTVFYHIPPQLFKNSKEIDSNGDKIIRIKDNKDNQSTSSLIHCVTFYHCINIAPCWAWYCDRCPLCETTICHNHDDDPPPGGGGGTGGGGTGGGGTGGGGGGTGGGGGGGNCGQVFYLIDPCGPIPPPTPCEIANAMAKKLDSLYIKCNIDSVLATIPNLATQPLEKGWAMVKKKITNPYNPAVFTFGNYLNDPIQTGTDSSVIIPYSLGSLQYLACFIHTHPPSGYAAESPFDIYEFLLNKMSHEYLDGNMVAAYNGDKYALTLTDSTKAAAFYQTKNIFLNGRIWNENSEIGKAFKNVRNDFLKKYKGNSNKENLAYEMAMSAVLNEFNSGVTLNKKDPVTGKFKPLVVKTVIPDPTKPKKKEYIQDCL